MESKSKGPSERRLFRLADGSWLQTDQTNRGVQARDFSIPSRMILDGDLDARLVGAQEVEIPRRRKTSPFVTRPEPRDAKLPTLPQTEAGPALLRYLAQSDVPTPPPGVIPLTPLRRFYEFLTFFKNKELHKAMAEFVAEPRNCEATLGRLFARSRERCQPYENKAGFHQLRPDDWRQKAVEETVRKPREAVRLVTRIGRAMGKLSAFPVSQAHGVTLDFTAVAYEVNPLRTTGAAYEDKTSARKSGGGGIDLLLRAVDGGLPILAETKAPKDTNSFLALVQALTYASELLTGRQFTRLGRAYPPAFGAVGSRQPCCDLYLIHFQSDKPALFDEAVRTARLLMDNPQGAVAQYIRRIVFLEANRNHETTLEFVCRRLLPSSGFKLSTS